jgi:hypothetical protein
MADDQRALLTLEIETIYGALSSDLPGGVRRMTREGVALVYGWGSNSSVLAVAPSFAELTEGIAWASHDGYGPDVVPAIVTEFVERLQSLQGMRGCVVDGGPSFTFPADLGTAVDSHLPIIGLDDPVGGWIDRLVRPENWKEWEWPDLLGGSRGSWSMALDGALPVAICHTPVATDRSSEAGVWTAPSYRRRGLAEAVVRDWYRQERDRHEVVYYSTLRNNTASRALARRLDLIPLGWLWTVA